VVLAAAQAWYLLPFFCRLTLSQAVRQDPFFGRAVHIRQHLGSRGCRWQWAALHTIQKLLVGVLFTPVLLTGDDRILLNQKYLRRTSNRLQLASLRRLVSVFLQRLLVCENNMSSVHLNFATDAEEASDIAGPIRNDQSAEAGGLDGLIPFASFTKQQFLSQ
jgi:hypothetical protein